MVCAKCQKKSQHTSLATPEVKKKNDMYLGSPAGSSSKAGTKTSATLGNNGIGKSKLLSKSARNPYATYSTTCTGKECSTKVDQGRKILPEVLIQSECLRDVRQVKRKDVVRRPSHCRTEIQPKLIIFFGVDTVDDTNRGNVLYHHHQSYSNNVVQDIVFTHRIMMD
ncbi:hypothetical protein EYC84_011774 [Monilinia fructicola]|uniref:Uncharacterized protein n=1 Tax=Monilinia fructicola TaxID=38448 RepID=A0A5M9J7Z3_MONFR|nr:hypothetical protein EYC84_011774 [Monilinia fructicola]